MMTIRAPVGAVPFADRLAVTVGRGDQFGLGDRLRDILPAAGFELREPGVWRVGWRGVVHTSAFARVFRVDVSGEALAALRAVGVYARFLHSFGPFAHNVTRLDAALDVPVDPPPVLAALYRSGRGGGISLTRKRASIRRLQSPRAVDGEDTGTVYIGHKNARISATVYDKVQERIDRGAPDVPDGPLTRFELKGRHSALGATLRDAWDPSAFFWAHMAPDVLVPADGVSREWTPLGEGLCLEPLPDRDAMELLLRRVERSSELLDIVRQASGVAGGLAALRLRIDRMAEAVSRAPATVASASAVA